MRSSPVTVLTTYIMSEQSTVSSFTSGFPKTCSVFGVLALLLHPSTIFVHWSHCLICHYLKVHCRHAAQKQLLLWLLCSAWNINQDLSWPVHNVLKYWNIPALGTLHKLSAVFNFIIHFKFYFQIVQDIVGSILMVLVTVGYKTKLSALILVCLLGVLNFYHNAWWNIPSYKPLRDFLKYDFFQVRDTEYNNVT